MAVAQGTALVEDLPLNANEGAAEEQCLWIAAVGFGRLAVEFERVGVVYRAGGGRRHGVQLELFPVPAAVVAAAERTLDRHREGDRSGAGADSSHRELEVLSDALAQGEKVGIELGVIAGIEGVVDVDLRDPV